MPPYASPTMSMAEVQGPLLLGYLFAYLLYGVFLAQLFIYVRTFPQDSKFLKSFVWFVFAWETCSLGVMGFNAWNDLASGWGNPSTFKPIWSLSALLPLNGGVATLVELFFCWRIFNLGRLAKRNLLVAVSGVVACASLTQFAFTIYAGVAFQLASSDLSKVPLALRMIVIWLSAAAASDIAIALTMIYFLYTSKRGFKDTDSKLNKLITITIETGFLTAIVSITELALYVRNTGSNDHFAACLPNAKLYANVLMATLNARSALGGGASQVINNGTSSSASGKPLVAPVARPCAPPLWEDLDLEDQSGAAHLVTKSVVSTTVNDRDSYPTYTKEKGSTTSSFLEDDE